MRLSTPIVHPMYSLLTHGTGKTVLVPKGIDMTAVLDVAELATARASVLETLLAGIKV